MLTEEQKSQLRKALGEAEGRLMQNAQTSLEMSRARDTDQGRDSIDQSSSEEMLSTALRLRDREKKLLNKIHKAVDRLEKDTLDECEECGDPIGYNRLLARPVTTLCINCKESAEEQEKRHADGRSDEFSLD